MNQRDTRTEIIRAAIAIMSEEGYEGLSASRLASAAGTSKSNVFHHFRSIDDVPVAAFELIAEEIVATDFPPEQDVVDLIASMGAAAFAALRQERGFFAAYVSFLTRAIFDPGLKDKVRASLQRAKEGVLQAIEAQVSDAARAPDLANLTLALMDGAMLHALLLENDDELEQMWERFIALLERERSA